MKYLSNINRITNCGNLFGKQYLDSDISVPFFLMQPTTENYEITHEKNL